MGENINFLYNFDKNFYSAIKMSINFGTKIARSLLNHIRYLEVES